MKENAGILRAFFWRKLFNAAREIVMTIQAPAQKLDRINMLTEINAEVTRRRALMVKHAAFMIVALAIHMSNSTFMREIVKYLTRNYGLEIGDQWIMPMSALTIAPLLYFWYKLHQDAKKMRNLAMALTSLRDEKQKSLLA